MWLYHQDKITCAYKNRHFSTLQKGHRNCLLLCKLRVKKVVWNFVISIPDILPWQNFVTKNFSKSPKCHGTKCRDILPWQNFVTKIFSKSPKCHSTKCHAILPWQNFVTKILAKSPKCHLRKCHDIFCQADEQTLRAL